MLTLAELIRVIPDTGIVTLHRDPRAAAAFRCSLGEALRMLMTNDYDLDKIEKQWLSKWVPVLNGGSESRANFPDTHFHDVDYRRLITDPLGTAIKIFEAFGFRCDGEVETGLKKWLVDHPREKHGSHRYSLERYGLVPKGFSMPWSLTCLRSIWNTIKRVTFVHHKKSGNASESRPKIASSHVTPDLQVRISPMN
jgi:hypothetical protein